MCGHNAVSLKEDCQGVESSRLKIFLPLFDIEPPGEKQSSLSFSIGSVSKLRIDFPSPAWLLTDFWHKHVLSRAFGRRLG